MRTMIKTSLISIVILSLFSFTKSKEKTAVIKTSVVCDMCKERIEHDLVFEKGVKEVDVNVKQKTVTVTYRADKTDITKIRKAISKLGYKADDIPGDKKGFEKLPECCKAEGCGKLSLVDD